MIRYREAKSISKEHKQKEYSTRWRVGSQTALYSINTRESETKDSACLWNNYLGLKELPEVERIEILPVVLFLNITYTHTVDGSSNTPPHDRYPYFLSHDWVYSRQNLKKIYHMKRAKHHSFSLLYILLSTISFLECL